MGSYLPWYISSIRGGDLSLPTCSLRLGPTHSWHRVWEERLCLFGIQLPPPPFRWLISTHSPPGRPLLAFCQQLLTAAFPSRVLTNNTPGHKEEYL